MIMIPYHFIGFLNILYENVLQYVFLSDYVSQFLSNFPKTPLIGYEPAGLTVHPPPQNDRGWVHFFRMGV